MSRIKNMSINMAIEIARKYANDMKYFGAVDKDCVSRVCKLLLEEIETLRNINKFDSELIMEEFYKNQNKYRTFEEFTKEIENSIDKNTLMTWCYKMAMQLNQINDCLLSVNTDTENTNLKFLKNVLSDILKEEGERK